MDDGGRADDRLPWIEVPRQRSKPDSATRRAVGPLLLLLGLALAGGVAVMAFLAGRGAEPLPPEPRPGRSSTITPAPAPAPPVSHTEPVPVPAPPPTIAPTIPTAAPEPRAAPVTAAPEPEAEPAAPVAAAPEPAAAPVREPTTPRAEVATTGTSRPVAPPATVAVPRIMLPAPASATPPLYPWPSAAGPSGRVIQLGAYPNGRQTMAAWRRLSRAYPYLASLPRKVTVVRAGPGRRAYYRLRIGAQSSGHARSICNNLHRIGRGCIIV